MRPGSLALVLSVSLAAGPVGAQAPTPAGKPAAEAGGGVMELSLRGFENAYFYYRVAEVEPAGTIRLHADPLAFRENVRWHSFPAEGYYLLFTGPEPRAMLKRFYRCSLTDVGAERRLTVSVGRPAAARVRPGDLAFLIRPLGGTTALMRALPDAVEIGPAEDADSPESIMDARRRASIIHLMEIGIALNNYNNVVGAYPPAVVFGPDGKPWHSWRALLLPYLERGVLAEEYDYKQPWDSPKNLKVLGRMPSSFRDPASDPSDHFTHYAALVGPGAAFAPEGGRLKSGSPERADDGLRLGDVEDEPLATIAVAPVTPERKIPWTKPDDIVVGRDFPGLGKPGGIGAPYRRGGDLVAPVLFLDGKVLSITSRIPPGDLRALLTVRGKEPVTRESIPTAPMPAAVKDPLSKTLRIRVDGGKATATIE